MSDSFNTALDRLAAVLAADTALQAYAMTAWGKQFAVKRVLKPRVEVHGSSIPIIMITSPSVDKGWRIEGGRDNKHTVRLYVLFSQNDGTAAQTDLVRVEELIDDCLRTNRKLPDDTGNHLVRGITPTESANDEGRFHPVYGIVMDCEIEHRRD